MRYPASEKLEIIRLVEQSHLPVKRTLDRLGLPRSTFYAWYDRYQSGGVEALEDKAPMPARIWNRIPDDIRQQIVDLALEEPELSPRELAVSFTDTKHYFVSEASVCGQHNYSLTGLMGHTESLHNVGLTTALIVAVITLF